MFPQSSPLMWMMTSLTWMGVFSVYSVMENWKTLNQNLKSEKKYKLILRKKW